MSSRGNTFSSSYLPFLKTDVTTVGRAKPPKKFAILTGSFIQSFECWLQNTQQFNFSYVQKAAVLHIEVTLKIITIQSGKNHFNLYYF